MKVPSIDFEMENMTGDILKRLLKVCRDRSKWLYYIFVQVIETYNLALVVGKDSH